MYGPSVRALMYGPNVRALIDGPSVRALIYGPSFGALPRLGPHGSATPLASLSQAALPGSLRRPRQGMGPHGRSIRPQFSTASRVRIFSWSRLDQVSRPARSPCRGRTDVLEMRNSVSFITHAVALPRAHCPSRDSSTGFHGWWSGGGVALSEPRPEGDRGLVSRVGQVEAR